MRLIKRIRPQVANSYLSTVGMKIGQWNGIESTDAELSWVNYRAPRNADELFTLAHHAVGWLPPGEWKIFQIDNSTRLNAVEASLMNRFLGNSLEERDFNLIEDKTYLIQFGQNAIENQDAELLIASLVFIILLFQQNAYLISSRSTEGQLLGIQDGDLCFLSRNKDMTKVNNLLKIYEQHPASYSEWASSIIADMQEREIQS